MTSLWKFHLSHRCATSRHPDRGFPPRLTPPAQRIRHIGAVTRRNQGPTRAHVLGFVECHIRRPVRPAYAANQAQTEPAPAAHHNRIFVPSSSTYLQCLIFYRRLVTGPPCTVSITLWTQPSSFPQIPSRRLLSFVVSHLFSATAANASQQGRDWALSTPSGVLPVFTSRRRRQGAKITSHLGGAIVIRDLSVPYTAVVKISQPEMQTKDH